MLRNLRALFVCTSALFIASAARAATLNVGPGQPYTTIQSAIAAAAAGDTVLVAPGTYYENIDFTGKAITVTSSGGAALTTIDGGGIGSTVTFQTNEPRTAVLSNFTITHGGVAGSGAAMSAGNGIAIYNSAPTILNNTVTHNYCQNILATNAAPLIQGNVVSSSDNAAQCSYTATGGIMIQGYAYSAAGIALFPFVVGNTIELNTTGQVGSGLENGGAGIWIGTEAHAAILGNIVRHNTTMTGNGGGILAINDLDTTSIAVVNNLIYDNYAGCGGGALSFSSGYLDAAYTLLVASNTIVDNTAATTAIASTCSTASQIFARDAGESGPSVAFVNNIISGNTAGPAVECSLQGATPQGEIAQSLFDHNLFYNTSGPIFGTHCIDTSSKYGNLVGDAQFVDAANGNYHLQAASVLAVDEGVNSVLASIPPIDGAPVTTDFDGNPRVQLTYASSPTIDTGAYEYRGGLYAGPTTIVLTSSSYSNSAGANFTLTAAIASPVAVPTGSIAFFADSVYIGSSPISSTGIATMANLVLPPGVHSLFAGYSGGGNVSQAKSVVILVNIGIYTTTDTLTSSPNPSALGQPVTFLFNSASSDANFVQTPVILYDAFSMTTLATLMPNAAGVASFTTSTLAQGYHPIQAIYAGDATHARASANLTQQVIVGDASTTTLTCTPNFIGIGTQSQMVATVTSAFGTPTGSITFTDGGGALSQRVLVNGAVNLGYLGQIAGTHIITATYNTDGTFATSYGTCAIVVANLAVTGTLFATPEPSAPAAPFSITAALTPPLPGPALTGNVTFVVDGVTLGTAALSGNAATITGPALANGVHQLAASWPGNSTYPPVTLTDSHTVIADGLSITLNSSLNPSTYAQPVTFTATFTAVGYTGPSGHPYTGTLSFYNGTKLLAQQVPSSSGYSFTTAALPAGNNNIQAMYSGDAIFAADTSNAVPQLVNGLPTTTVLTVSPATAPFGTAFTLSAEVAPITLPGQGVPAGFITFFYGTTNLGNGQVSSSGVATLTTSALPAGPYALTCAYSGSTVYATSACNTVAASVTPVSAGLTLTTAPNPAYTGQTVTLAVTAVAAGGAYPSGMVTLLDGTTSIGIAPLNATGQATFATSSLLAGTHPLTATLSAAGNFTATASNTVLQVILPSTFAITLAPTSVTVHAGLQTSAQIQLASIGNFAGPLTLSYGPLPSYATVAITPTTVTLVSGGTGAAILTLNTEKRAQNEIPTRPGPRALPITALAGALLLLYRRKRTQRLLALCLCAVLLQGLSGCANAYYELNLVQPGTYALPITATDSHQNAHTATLTVTVTP